MTCSIRLSLFAFLLLAVTGCQGRYLEPYSEVVMSSGMSIEGTNPNGTVYITAGDGTLRSYKGDEWETSIRLISRSTRWDYSLGLYDPAGSSSPFGRVLVEEGQLHVHSIDEALRILYVGSLYSKPVFTNTGLVFCFAITKPNESWQGTVRTVKIWQIYVDGKRPTTMPGGDDNAIKVTGGVIADSAQPHQAQIGNEMVLGVEPYDPRK